MTPQIHNLLTNCGCVTADDRILVLCDATTRALAERVYEGAKALAASRLLEIPTANRHGQEPPDAAAAAMRQHSLILSLCQFSLAHTNARVAAARSGARFLSLPSYDEQLLDSDALLVDYHAHYRRARAIADLLTAGESVHITTALGTDMRLDIRSRVANCCPGFVRSPGDLGSPPDIEANISPLEYASYGRVVVDGSIPCPEIGLLDSPVTMEVRDGRIAAIHSESGRYVATLDEMLGAPDSKRRVLAECGIGLNPACELTGTMLTDEGALGCVHFGFGANHTVGGVNEVDFHLDFVFRRPTLTVGDTIVLRQGTPCL